MTKGIVIGSMQLASALVAAFCLGGGSLWIEAGIFFGIWAVMPVLH